MTTSEISMPTLVRRRDWPERLAHFLEVRARLPFAWGLNDCALFAADCACNLTEVDLAADLRGAYGNREEADAVLARHGGLQALVAARLPVYVSPLQCHRGDVVCVEAEQEDGARLWTLGVVAGNGYWAAPGARRMVYRPMAEVLHAYAVG